MFPGRVSAILFSLHYTKKSSHRAFFCSFASFISDELTKKAGELRKAFLKAPLHFFLRSLRFSNVTPPGTMPKQGWMLKTSPSFQRMENGDLPAKVRKYDQASHNVWLKAYPIHQYTSESEMLLWTSSNVDGCKNHWPGSTNTTLFSVSEPTITNLPLMRKTSAKSVTTPSFRVTFVSTLCVDNVSLLRNGYANSRKPSKQSLAPCFLI